MPNQNGSVSKGGLLVAILVIALIVVLILWQRDRESQDVNIDIGQAVPELIDSWEGIVA